MNLLIVSPFIAAYVTHFWCIYLLAKPLQLSFSQKVFSMTSLRCMYLIGQAVDLSVKENFALFVNDIFIEALQDLVTKLNHLLHEYICPSRECSC